MTETKRIRLPFKIKKPVLALGPQTKNTVCFASGDLACLGPVRENLDHPDDFSRFEKAVKFFLKKKPKVIAYDLHPGYQSTQYALLLAHRYRLAPVQHHHAHIASAMAQNQLANQLVIGVAFDGTGLGNDGRIWGAEFLVCDYRNFRRAGHLKEIPLLGLDKAISEPWRLSVAWLYQTYKDAFLNLKIKALKTIAKNKWKVLKKMYISGFNSAPASSMGRLFDAVAYLIFEKQRVDFEAQLAIRLQKCACLYRPGNAAAYDFGISNVKNEYIIDPRPMFRQIIGDLKAKKPKERIAYAFHLTVARMVEKTCLLLRRDGASSRVVLSGGVFQNNLLLKLVSDLLYKDKFSVITAQKLSCNDSGISLGQAAIANFTKD